MNGQKEKGGLRWGKLLTLGTLLGLCLALSGCYIAPDEINEANNYPTNNNPFPFPTLAPTETVAVTPDTVVIPTQNLYPYQNNGSQQGVIAVTDSGAAAPTPTPTQGSAGWSEWGTVTGVTNTPEPGWTASIAPTSTPDSSTIIFSTRTPSPDGQGGTSAGSTTTPRTTIQIVTAPPATPTPTPKSLQRGFTDSEEVKALQKRLKALGWYTGSADGDFGPATEAAVKAFQKANGLTADGKAGQKTLEKLNSSSAISKKQANATPKPTAKAKAKGSTKTTAKPTAKATAKATKKPTATPRPTATPNLTKDIYLQKGASGQKVKTLQNRLIQLGWLGGKVTGTYDDATEAAVRAFQKKTKGLWEDGVAGPDTLKALYADSAARASNPASSTGETLEKGSEGDAVRTLQKRLKELGYLSGSVDGSFGIATEAAVIAFQQRNGLTADGKAGNATLNRLYSEDAIKNGGSPVDTSAKVNTTASTGANTSDIASTGYVTLEEGSRGDAVRRLQERLKKLGYYNGSVDGSFGEGTAAAVMAFQLRNNLTVDGKAGPATQRTLYGEAAAISYSALREGEEGSAVRNLQYTLYELGYYDGKIDGSYGATTADAVRAFQIQNKLSPVDGVAGSGTLARLYSPEAISATAAVVDYDTARPGDTGELVVEIQDCLMQAGFLEKITGVYDDATVAAVKAFQKANGLVADGVAGDKTLVILFGY